MRPRVFNYPLLAIGLIVVYLAAVWYGQRVMLFPAAWLPAPVGAPRGEPVRPEPAADAVDALFLAPAAGTPEPFPLIIFAHGNGELADDWVDAFAQVREWGWVLLFEYPGYGRRPGTPSEAAIRRASTRRDATGAAGLHESMRPGSWRTGARWAVPPLHSSRASGRLPG